MARSISIGDFVALTSLALALSLGTALGCSSDDEDGGGTGNNSGTGANASGSASGGAGGGDATSSSSSSSATTGSGGEASGGAGGESAGGNGGDASGGGNAGGNGGGNGAGGAMAQDADGDGWTTADGDCCDALIGDICDEPAKVNPGAFEYLGNNVDDDCDPSTTDTDPPADCGGAPLATPTTSDELAHAMDLCQFTTEAPALPDKKWGVISTSLHLADGAATPDDVQTGVLGDFGTNVAPKKHATMAAISSGTARALGDAGYVHPQNGSLASQVGNYDAGTQSNVPAAWLAANGGSLPNPANCPACSGATCTKAYDSVNLKLRIRVPTNALSFSYNFKFYTAEYPEFVCKQYNDFFIALLTSTEPSIPPDKNIAFDGQGNEVSVNNGFLDVCFPTPTSPPGSCPHGTTDLVGNGMGGWGTNQVDDGGGTVWLTNDAPVVPGETIELEFITWDAADHNVDSLVLIDNFRFKIAPSQVGTHE